MKTVLSFDNYSEIEFMLKDLVAKSLGLAHAEIEIVKNWEKPIAKPVPSKYAGMTHWEIYKEISSNFSSENKIGKIKALREAIHGLCLVEAKYLIEAGPARVLSYWNLNKTLFGFNWT